MLKLIIILLLVHLSPDMNVCQYLSIRCFLCVLFRFQNYNAAHKMWFVTMWRRTTTTVFIRNLTDRRVRRVHPNIPWHFEIYIYILKYTANNFITCNRMEAQIKLYIRLAMCLLSASVQMQLFVETFRPNDITHDDEKHHLCGFVCVCARVCCLISSICCLQVVLDS